MIKNIILKYFATALIALVVFSCDDGSDELQKEKEMRLLAQYLESKNITVEPESSGLYFIPTHEGDGLKPERDNWVIIRYTAKTINDRIFDTTEENIAVSNNIYSSSQLYGEKRMKLETMGVIGVAEGLMLMREGGSATLIMPSHLGYGSAGIGLVPPYATLIYDIDLIKVIRNPVEYEEQIIDNYIAMYADSTHLVVDKRESGLYFISISEGTGEEFPEDSDMVSVYYRGTLIDGRQFDSNIGGSPFSFAIGGNQAITGFEEGVTLMKKDGRSRIVVPSSLGYGDLGSGDKIVGYTPLVFDLELADILQ